MRFKIRSILILFIIFSITINGFTFSNIDKETQDNYENDAAQTGPEVFTLTDFEGVIETTIASPQTSRGPSARDPPGLYNGLINYSDVLLIINNDSAISKDIGNYFAENRGLPDENICNISTSTAETINGATFTDMRSQIEDHITSNGLRTKINYIVTTKGIPLRVNWGACVDAELALILGGYSGSIGQGGYLPNPYYNDEERFSKEKYDFYLVTRLTGYTAAEAKGLVDKAELSYGKRGMFMLDVSPGRDVGGYKVGNDWMRSAYTILNNKGFNVTLDETTPFITDTKNVSGYTSWGSNDGAYTTNIVLNANLEQDSDGDGVPNLWYAQRDSGDTWARNDTDVYSASWAVNLTRNTVTANTTKLSQNVTVKPGYRYYMSGFANLTNMSSTGKGAYLQIAARDKFDNIVKYYNGSARRPDTNDYISLKQVPYEPIAGVTKLTVSVVVEECSGSIYIDLIRLFEIKPNNTYIPGGITETYVSTGGRTFAYPPTYGQSLIADQVREGVTGVKGYVYEPLLDAIAHPDILFDRYTDGYNLAESYYMASIKLSWMDVVVGDPKVAPYMDELAELTASSADLNFSIEEPTEGEEVTIQATIYNSGKRSADNFKTQFYIGDPKGAGTPLGTEQSITIAGGSSGIVEYTWDTSFLSGVYNIYLKFDVDDSIMEPEETEDTINRTIYINSRPEVESYWFSGNSLKRTEILTIKISGNDLETPESGLICYAEFKPSNADAGYPWETFPQPQYFDQNWTYLYTINTTVTTGSYDVRIMFSDNHTPDHPGLSDWTVITEVFEISNNAPDILGLLPSRWDLNRTENVSFEIKANDIETANVDLTCELYIQYPDSGMWHLLGQCVLANDSWYYTYQPPATADLGVYSFRALAYDDDSPQGVSAYKTLDNLIEVKNNPVVINNISVNAPEVYRLNDLEVAVQVNDIEDPDEDMFGTVEYRYNGTFQSDWKALSKFSYRLEKGEGIWYTNFKPAKTAAPGNYDFRAMFTDLDGGTFGWSYLTNAVNVLNNPPHVESLTTSDEIVVQGEDSIEITVQGYDVENTRSELKCEIQVIYEGDYAGDSSSDQWRSINTSLVKNYWKGVFQSEETDQLGFYHIRTRLLDPDIILNTGDGSDDEYWIVFLSEFNIRSGFPDFKEITIEPDTVSIGDPVNIRVTTMGNLTENSELTCIIEFQSQDISDTTWVQLDVTFDRTTEEGVWLVEIPAGNLQQSGTYNFRLRFLHSILGVTPWIYPENDLTVNSGKSSSSTEEAGALSQAYMIGIIIIVIIVVIITIFFFMRIRKKKDRLKKPEGTDVPVLDAQVVGDQWLPGGERGPSPGLPGSQDAYGSAGQAPAVMTAEPVAAGTGALPGTVLPQVSEPYDYSVQPVPFEERDMPLDYQGGRDEGTSAETTNTTGFQEEASPVPQPFPSLPPGPDLEDIDDDVPEEITESEPGDEVGEAGDIKARKLKNEDESDQENDIQDY
jgi:uncharacterized protein (TIGR03790 family)